MMASQSPSSINIIYDHVPLKKGRKKNTTKELTLSNIETTNTLPQQADTVLGHLFDDLTSRCKQMHFGRKKKEDLIIKEHWL